MKLSGNLTPTDLCNARNIEAPTFVVLSCTILPLPPFCFVNRELVGNSIVIAPCPGKIVTDIPRLLIDLNFLCWCKTWKHCVTLQRCKKCICTCMQFDAGLSHCWHIKNYDNFQSIVHTVDASFRGSFRPNPGNQNERPHPPLNTQPTAVGDHCQEHGHVISKNDASQGRRLVKM